MLVILFEIAFSLSGPNLLHNIGSDTFLIILLLSDMGAIDGRSIISVVGSRALLNSARLSVG